MPEPNAEEIRARVTVLADGTRGVLSEQLRDHFGAGQNPQVYSLGAKAVMQFKEEHPFGAGHVAHFLGYPLPQNVFGGGFLYATDANTKARISPIPNATGQRRSGWALMCRLLGSGIGPRTCAPVRLAVSTISFAERSINR